MWPNDRVWDGCSHFFNRIEIKSSIERWLLTNYTTWRIHRRSRREMRGNETERLRKKRVCYTQHTMHFIEKNIGMMKIEKIHDKNTHKWPRMPVIEYLFCTLLKTILRQFQFVTTSHLFHSEISIENLSIFQQCTLISIVPRFTRQFDLF